jgi:toxin YoeB
MRILWDERGWEDYLWWQMQDKKTLRKINSLIKDMQRSPYEGIGKPEPLSGNLSGWWSRRIDDDNRIVYKVMEDNLVIANCKSHYGDK